MTPAEVLLLAGVALGVLSIVVSFAALWSLTQTTEPTTALTPTETATPAPVIIILPGAPEVSPAREFRVVPGDTWRVVEPLQIEAKGRLLTGN
jgi:hypothetical protein